MGQNVTLAASDGHELTAYSAGLPDAPRALVVVQELFGVNHHIRSVVDGFAASGFYAIAPALFDRAERDVALSYDEGGIAAGRALAGRIDAKHSLLDLTAAADWLARDRVGIVGYCFGGSLAWWAATRTRVFAASVGWYGGMTTKTADEVPNCPVQLHFGEADALIPPDSIAAFRQARPEVEVFVYPGAGHGFGCDERASFDARATTLAQEHTLAFLQHHL